MKTPYDPTRPAPIRANAHHVADEHAVRAAPFADQRPEARAQQRLQALADASPQAVAQRKLQQRIDRSPRMTAQRQLLNGGSEWTDQAQGDEEELLQAKPEGASGQRAAMPEEEPLRGRRTPGQKRENKTGLPDGLKAGIERLSGRSMDGVKVHYNSALPAQLRAAAYTQGTQIHVGPGQERHLPHEAWHVVQQNQGRVRPRMQMKGVKINDDRGLEKEADVMGAKADQVGDKRSSEEADTESSTSRPPAQLKGVFQLGNDKKQQPKKKKKKGKMKKSFGKMKKSKKIRDKKKRQKERSKGNWKSLSKKEKTERIRMQNEKKPIEKKKTQEEKKKIRDEGHKVIGGYQKKQRHHHRKKIIATQKSNKQFQEMKKKGFKNYTKNQAKKDLKKKKTNK